MSLRIYPVILELIREVRYRFLPRIQAGGSGSRYYSSVGSTREALSCLEVAFAMGYIPEIDPEPRAKFDHVIGTLVNLVKPRPK